MLRDYKIPGKIHYSKQQKRIIKKLIPFKGGEWNKSSPPIQKIKGIIKITLLKIQENKCAYCGLSLEETSSAQIEHIAPKGGSTRPKYVRFTFTPYNLVLACSYCNGFTKKGTIDTIIIEDINYKKCVFSIVHPYFDDPNLHFDWTANGPKILISSSTQKGKETIRIFKLDSPRICEARAKLVMYEKEHLLPDYEEKLKNVLDYKRRI